MWHSHGKRLHTTQKIRQKSYKDINTIIMVKFFHKEVGVEMIIPNSQKVN